MPHRCFAGGFCRERNWLGARQDQALHKLCQRLADRRLEVEADELKHRKHFDRHQFF
jgi:hypothetical protein